MQDWLRGLGIVLVAADELRHETLQPDRAQSGLPQGQATEVLPIAMSVTVPTYFYVRVHRRCAMISHCSAVISQHRPTGSVRVALDCGA